ncbi:SPFH domain-containing protein [Bradyrhizobium jicamae]|uniref:SPFH domain-containing protein n=1 Tax=Bradyrhizobium jicamae TaxID=280332 RepID=A0ABS5FFH1_9BRAD|nr:SPFH domain-containing protein [Bradyrhizobium jicamae]MBR0795543.1 SPFH domain-containing protein [Bradyrhizobium jicamae]MBR0932582.1 SPFH domain-containing protein [Bradyrhizobium jicamae]
MTIQAPTGSSAIRVNTRVEDRPAIVVGSGYIALLIGFACLLLSVYTAYGAFWRNGQVSWLTLFCALCLFLIAVLFAGAIYTLQPNESAVLTLFGSYAGTDSAPGLRATIPLFHARKVSQRVRYNECEKLKVNDLIGNPIEIGAVVVWRVEDCAKAIFQINDYADFVGAQTESALRHIAGRHPYDFDEASSHPASDAAATPEREAARTLSLRESGDQVTNELIAELRDRLTIAGVTIDEAWINHLAYAPEIAPVMLRRQQASAVIAARKLVVSGAVEIVKEALDKLREETDIDLDPERKAAMVSNLLVVLVSDKDATPVVNTGTLYA